MRFSFTLNSALGRRLKESAGRRLQDAYANAIGQAVAEALAAYLPIGGEKVSIELDGFDVIATVQVATRNQANIVRDAVVLYPCATESCFWLELQNQLPEALIAKTDLVEVSVGLVEFAPPSAPAGSTVGGTLESGEQKQSVAEGSEGLTSGAIAGVVIGLLGGLVLLGLAAYLFVLKRRLEQANQITLTATQSGRLLGSAKPADVTIDLSAPPTAQIDVGVATPGTRAPAIPAGASGDTNPRG